MLHAVTVFFPPTHRHPASTNPAQSVSVPSRHASDKSSVVTSFETGICIHRKYNKIPCTYAAYTHACGAWVVLSSMVAGFLAFSRRQFALTISHIPLSASHYFSFLSKRSGRRMPPAERSALYIYFEVYTLTQVWSVLDPNTERTSYPWVLVPDTAD